MGYALVHKVLKALGHVDMAYFCIKSLAASSLCYHTLGTLEAWRRDLKTLSGDGGMTRLTI